MTRTPLRDKQNRIILAKLRCAVKHAGLAAHKQRPNLMFLDRRKDLSDRVCCEAQFRGCRHPRIAVAEDASGIASEMSKLQKRSGCPLSLEEASLQFSEIRPELATTLYLI